MGIKRNKQGSGGESKQGSLEAEEVWGLVGRIGAEMGQTVTGDQELEKFTKYLGFRTRGEHL